MLFFTADLHLFHENIIDFAERPFRDLDDMHEQLIARWNSKVGTEDLVYILGDVGFGKKGPVASILWRLNGMIRVLLGNHDDQGLLRKTGRFDSIEHYVYMKQPIKVVLCHFPFAAWERKAIHFHGHSHGRRENIPGRIDVGVDCHDYYPMSINELCALVEFGERPIR